MITRTPNIFTMRHRCTDLIFLLFLAVFCPSVHSEPTLQSGDSFAIVGDSITQARKYSVLIETYLLISGAADESQTMVHGWSGEQMSGIDRRVENDVLRFSPDVVTLSYGMNDGRYRPFDPVLADAYGDNTRRVVQKLREHGTRLIVVGSPGCVDPVKFTRTRPASIYNDTLTKFSDIARTIAEEEGVRFAEVNRTLRDAQELAKSRFGDDFAFLGQDGYHPDWAGHMAMAYAYLKAMVGDHEVGRITMDFAEGSTESSAGHRVLSSEAGVIELESKRYPLCFFGKPNDPAGTRIAADLTPFNEELNRFVLVVNNAPARCVVTWGDAAHEFTAAQLQQGVNLSAVFVDNNPFYDSFKNVFTAVRNKQTFEIHLIKAWVTDLPIVEERLLPKDNADVERLTESILEERQARLDQIKSLLVPVRHRIRVQPLP